MLFNKRKTLENHNMLIRKTHNRTLFYKYMKCKHAYDLLNNLTLRWSCPTDFNDPFDTNLVLRFPEIDNNELNDLCETKLRKVLGDDIELSSDVFELTVSAIIKLRDMRGHISHEQFEMCFNELKMHALNMFEVTERVCEEEIKNIANMMSVFCISEIYDNLLMWSHYADDHKGLVIELKCLPEKNTPLCAAEEVEYQKEYPIVCSHDFFLDCLTGVCEMPVKDFLRKMALTKSTDWEYEKEWRCISYRVDFNNHFEDAIIYEDEINAIYLGCKISPEDQSNIIDIVKEKFPHVRIYKARLKEKKFALDFDLIR